MNDIHFQRLADREINGCSRKHILYLFLLVRKGFAPSPRLQAKFDNYFAWQSWSLTVRMHECMLDFKASSPSDIDDVCNIFQFITEMID